MPEIYLVFLLLSFLLFTGVKLFSFLLKSKPSKQLGFDSISVIIPFRNEELNLPGLLHSILGQKTLPKELIFINDHSTDGSLLLLESFIADNSIGMVISLNGNNFGKKAALDYGVQNSTSKYVLTLDADVVLNENYFESINSLPVSGLTSLPVIMKGSSFLSRVFSVEYQFFNALNFLFASIWPFSISGANLLFDNSVVDYSKQLKSHHHIPSGDDFFLLKKFRNNNLSIHVSNDYNLSVETKSPPTLKAYFTQRVRWLSKSKYQVDWLDFVIGLFIITYLIGGFVALLSALILEQWLLLGSVFVLRLLIDSLLYLNYAQALRKTNGVFVLPIFQLIYPVLFIGVMIMALFHKPEWKGRSTA